MLTAGLPRAGRGFGLLETMIVLAVLAVVMAVALPDFRLWMQNYQIKAASQALLAGIQSARVEAVRRNVRVAVTVGSSGDWTYGCAVPTDACPATIASGGREGTSNIVVTTVPEGAPVLTFNPFGLVVANVGASAGVATPTAIVVDASGGGVSADQTRDLRIDIGTGGSLRLCDPSLDASKSAMACSSE